MNKIELLHLPVRQHVPDLGSQLRTGYRIEEIAILVDGVLYHTLPCIATLVFPEPDKWKKSWETVYRSLMPHRRNIVVKEISSYFQISPKSLPPQLIVQLGICEEGWPYIRKTTRTYHQFSPDKKNAQKNLFGILFSFVPRRLLPDKHRTQSHSTFFWAHNTNMQAAISILRDEELIRPYQTLEMARATSSQSRLHWQCRRSRSPLIIMSATTITFPFSPVLFILRHPLWSRCEPGSDGI